jgi:uncharacterized membrane protein
MSRRVKSSLSRRAEASGVLVAGANIPLTFQRTLMPRGSVDQAIVTGLSISTNRMVVTLAQEALNAGAVILARRRFGRVDPRALSRAAIALDAGAIGAGLLAQRAFAQREDESLRTAALRTAGFWTSVAGTAGLIVAGLDEGLQLSFRGRRRAVPVVLAAAGALASVGEWQRRRREHLNVSLASQEGRVETGRALAFGVGMSAGTFAMAGLERRAADAMAATMARVLPGDAELYRPVGHALALGASAAATRFVMHHAFTRIESQQGAVETAFDIPPPSAMLSGSNESHVPFPTLSLQGRRFVWMVTPEDLIERVTGERPLAQPIRAYVGLESAETEAARVELALKELDRTGAFDREYLMVVSPTGTGYVNYAAVSALEFLSRGNCATVAMQYAARPSVLSLGQVAEGRAHMTLLLEGIRTRLAQRPPAKRPKIVLFGESLGAWTSQDPFVGRGAQGLIDAGIDYAIWIGTPHFSKWKDQVLHEGGDVEQRVVDVFDNIDEWRMLADTARKDLRFVMVTHQDDGVALFGPELCIQAPTWLGHTNGRPARVPKGMRWVPTTTFFQVLVDMKNSATVVPGVFDAKGHDYRADLVPFFDAVLGFDSPRERLAAIEGWLETREKMRTEWVKSHGDAGRSLSATVLERLLERERAAGRDPDASLLAIIRDVASLDQAAG